MNDEMQADKSATAKGNGSGDGLGSNAEIGRKLKQYYDELISEEVPERFTNLLKQLEDSERGSDASRSE